MAIVSQGSPEVHTERLKKAGMKVIHVCATVKHARKAEEVGVDAVVASGTEGGGHSGFNQNTTFCLVPLIAGAIKIPVLAGGGVADGRQLISALSLGAEGVYIGTRFIATKESPAHENYKRAVVESKIEDTIAIRHGSPKKSGSGDRGFTDERRGSVRLILSPTVRDFLGKHSGAIDYDILMKAYGSVPNNKGGSSTAAALMYGDSQKGFFAAGQGVGLINEILNCEEVIRKMMIEAEDARQRIISIS